MKHDLTPAQKDWLLKLKKAGFVSRGGWGDGQRNRPLDVLCKKGLAVETWGPKGSFLKTQGYEITPAGRFVTLN